MKLDKQLERPQIRCQEVFVIEVCVCEQVVREVLPSGRRSRMGVVMPKSAPKKSKEVDCLVTVDAKIS